MIKTKLMLTACASALLAACTSNAPEIPDTELYTRKFVKEFGVMDSRQDWNNASRGNVQVSTGKASRIRVTTMIGNHNYLLADYADVQGKRTLEFDIPKGITDITVSDGTNNYDTKVGGSVTFGSRNGAAITDGNTEQDFITVTDMTGNEFRDQWKVIPWIDATRFTRKMPEECYNGNREGVTTDFMFKSGGQDIVIYPLYWQTRHNHTLGLYYIDDKGEIVKVPIWQMDRYAYNSSTVYSIVQSDVREIELSDDDEDVKEAFGGKKLSELNVQDNVTETRFGPEVLADISEITNALVSIFEKRGITYNFIYRWSNKDIKNKDKNNVAPDLGGKWKVYYTYLNYTTPRAPGNSNNAPEASSDNWDSVLSKGIKVHFSKSGVKFGAYILSDEGEIFYSMASRNYHPSYNIKEGYENKRGNNNAYNGKYPAEAWEKVDEGESYAATWKGTKYGWRYLGFEDWREQDWGHSSDMDLNDLVFIIEGLDPSKEVVDPNEPDEPDPTPGPTPIKWLVACEDLGAMDDFDFNDVVFEVEHVSGQTEATITPLAAGGTLETYLMRDGVKVNETEWHALFGSAPSNAEINASAVTKTAEPFKITVPADFSLSSSKAGEGYKANMGGFHINVKRDDGETSEITPPGEGEAPQMILIYQSADKKWSWPKERHSIKDAYPKFADWMNGGDYTVNPTGANWYDEAVSIHLVQRN